MSTAQQQNFTQFRIRIIEGRRKYLVESMEFRKQQLKTKAQTKESIENIL